MDWDLALTTDDVIRGQGADPAVIRARSRFLVKAAEEALQEGLALVRPRVAERRFPVVALRHDRVELAGGGLLAGELIAQHLAAAQQVAVVVCTIGDELEARVAEVMGREAVRGLALYGVGSAAVEALANTICRRIELEAAERGWQTTIPLSPGMIGWPVEQGQPQIFELTDGGRIGVELTDSGVMVPLKSLSMVVGLGPNLVAAGRTCDYCAMRETCRYQDHYAPAG